MHCNHWNISPTHPFPDSRWSTATLINTPTYLADFGEWVTVFHTLCCFTVSYLLLLSSLMLCLALQPYPLPSFAHPTYQCSANGLICCQTTTSSLICCPVPNPISYPFNYYLLSKRLERITLIHGGGTSWATVTVGFCIAASFKFSFRCWL